MPANKQQIMQMWNLLVRPGNVHEFRAPKCGKSKTVSGYFDNADGLIAAVEEWNGQTNLYLTLNPVNPALLARAANHAKPYAENATADGDILRRRWLPVDLDACRPAGISSSEEEHKNALNRAKEVQDFLCRYDIPCVLADSGNGGHLLIPVDLPNDEASRLLVEGFLTTLALIFDDKTVKVDTSCANAARIWKIYGSLACKGDNMPDRRHRNALLIEVPDDLSPVSVDRLQQIADLVETPESPTSGRITRPATDGSST